MRILLLVALEKEIEGFDFNHGPVDVVFTGVGKLNAYKATRDALRRKHYDVIINAGTCGSCVIPKGETIHPVTIYQGDAFISEPFKSEPIVCSGNYGSTCISLLTSDNFISEAEGTLKPVHKLYTAFDMEGYAIASAASFMKEKVFFIKIVSDNLEGSVSDWNEEVKKLAPILAERIQYFININFDSDYVYRRL